MKESLRLRLFKAASVSTLLLALAVQTGRQANAQIITLVDGGAVAQINAGSQAGMFNWTIQGIPLLAQQWFWYRLGPTGPESSIDTIAAPTITLSSGTRGVTLGYASLQMLVQIDYLLTGSAPVASGQVAVSDIAETIRIQNTSAAPLDLHFYQYSDFDLGAGGGDTIQLGRNLGGLFNEALQQFSTVAVSETVLSPGANHGEVGLFPNTLNKLNNGVADTLSDNAGPLGPADTTWAFQWDRILNPGSSLIISKDKNLSLVVPEPSAVGILSLCVAVAVWRRRSV